MPADRRLRQLEHGAKLGNRELVALEHQQHAAAGGVGQGGQVIENCCFHPSIRMKCCINPRWGQAPHVGSDPVLRPADQTTEGRTTRPRCLAPPAGRCQAPLLRTSLFFFVLRRAEQTTCRAPTFGALTG